MLTTRLLLEFTLSKMNGLLYRGKINDFSRPETDGIHLENVYFQQDGATCHTSKETIDLLSEKFFNIKIIPIIKYNIYKTIDYFLTLMPGIPT